MVNATAEIETELEPLVVSATRLPEAASQATSSVTVLDPLDLEERGIFDLRTALNEVPGVISTSTAGQSGAIGSLFIRGTTTSYSQVVVDGIRVSNSTSPAGNFLSGAQLDDLGRIELLRGPQAAIFGGEAVGGVLWLETAQGEGEPETKLSLEGGSFDTLNGSVSTSGQEGQLSWFAGFGYDGTHNDDIGQDYDQSRGALRLDWAQNDKLTLGMTFRATDSRYEYQSFGENVDHLDTLLATIYANAELAPGWMANFTLGHYRENYDNTNTSTFGSFDFGTDVERTVFSTDQSYEINDQHKLLAGGFLENNDFENSIGVDQSEIRYGTHLGWQWTPASNFTTDAVVRWEDYADYGDEITWRVGASWQALENTRFSGGVGRAFQTPTYLDLFGTAFGPGNANLDAETSIGWDIGIEQKYAESHLVSVTYFQNTIDDQIARPFAFPAVAPFNQSGDSETYGIETALRGSWADGQLSYQVAYTYLGAALSDFPENVATASLDWKATEKLRLGIGATFTDERSYGGGPLDDYLLLRVYGSYQITEAISLHARVENLADEEYELANFGTTVPGAGLGVFTGVTATF